MNLAILKPTSQITRKEPDAATLELARVNNLISEQINKDLTKPEKGKKASPYQGIASTYRKFNDGRDNLDTFKEFLLSDKFKSSTKENLKNYFSSILKRLKNEPDAIKTKISSTIKETFKLAIEETKDSKNRIEKEQESMIEGKDYLKIDAIKKVCSYLETKPTSKKFNTDEKGNLKLSLIIRFLFQTGCRIDELIQIRKSETLLNGVAKVKLHGKGSKSRKAEIDRNFYHEIENLFDGKEYLFESNSKTKFKPQNLWKKISDSFLECGYGNKSELLGEKYLIHPHTLRHSFAMHKLDNGMDVKTLSYLLGHVDVAITLRTYIHPNTDKYKDLIMEW
jgi:site-specific recombinase XerD